MFNPKFLLLALPMPLVMASIMISNSSIQADGGSTGIANGPSTLQVSPPGAGLLNLVFGPDTDDDYVSEVYEDLNGEGNIGFFGLSASSRWDSSRTATNDGGPEDRGEGLTLTYSFIPDGTNMAARFGGDTGCNSVLIATLDDLYGAANWRNEIDEVFAMEWGGKTGNKYVLERNDDGAAWPDSPGILGVRGDIRIGGCAIDGKSGILAYNFFPSLGDMKIEVTDDFFKPGNLELGFHNVISHEHGHGAGISHVCPLNRTKLMEPMVSSSFIGMQHADIRAAQWLYGDFNESIGGGGNDTAAQPTDFGAPADNVPVLVSEVSIDSNDDEDWHRFTVGASKEIDVTVDPVGFTYPVGPQNRDGTCSAGTPTNSLAIHNLAFEVIDSDGTTVLASVDARAAGFGETLSSLSLGAAGPKYIRVIGNGTDDVQLYDLSFTVSPAVAPELVFTVQPTDTAAGTIITPPVKVAAQNGSGNTVVDFTGEITVAIDANPFSGVLSGTTVVAAEKGIATFTDLSIARSGAGYTLVASAPGLAGGSSAFAISGGDVADLSLSKTVNNSSLSEEDPVVFVLTVSNAGPDGATGVQVTDVLPSGFIFLSASASSGNYEIGTGVWSVGELASDASATLNLTASIDSSSADSTITDSAEITASDQADPDSTPGNNVADEDDQDRVSIDVGGSGGPDAPETVITSSPSGVSHRPEATFTFTSSKDGSTFGCNLDGSGFSPCISPQSYPALPEGNHTFQVRAIDSSGIPDQTPASFAWAVKAAPPANQAPLARDQAVVTSQDVALAVPLAFTDPDGPGPYSFTIVTPPNNGDLTNLGPNPTYTPTQGFTGSDSIQWQVNDTRDASNIATVSIIVDPVNSLINDSFDRPDDALVGAGWVEVEEEGASLAIANGQLFFADTSDLANRPMVRRSFSPVSSGTLQWDFDIDWNRTENENTYRFLMQLGDSAVMDDDSQNGGAGVNLVWTQIGGVHQSLGFREGGVDTALAVLSGPAHITVVADLEARSYSVAVDDAEIGTDLPFDAEVALNTVRYFTDAINEKNVLGRFIDNVIVSASDPTVSVTIDPGNTLLSGTFDHPDRISVDEGWVEVEQPGASVTISDEKLFFEDTSDVANRPLVKSSFNESSTGTLTWGFDFNWTRTGDESTYRLLMQLGDSTVMTDDSQNGGVGINLIWTKIGGDHEILGYRDGDGDHALEFLSGAAHIIVMADLSTRTYSLEVDNMIVGTGIPFDNNVSLDTVRFITDSLNESKFSGRTFDNVVISDLVDP